MTGQSERKDRLTDRESALREQEMILVKSMAVFGRAVTGQACILLFIAAAPFLSANLPFRAITRLFLGQTWINALFGITLLLLYAGIRKQNFMCSIGVVIAEILAMAYSPFLRTAYGQIIFYPGNTAFPKMQVTVFILAYLLPFSIILFQFPAFLRWRKIRERYQDRLDDRMEGIFGERKWKPGIFMAVWVVLLAMGCSLCIKDEADYRRAMDLSAWEPYTLPGSGFSVTLPPDGLNETEYEGSSAVQTMGDRFGVYVLSKDATEDDEEVYGEAASEETERGAKVLSKTMTGMTDGVEYRQTAMRQFTAGAYTDIYTRMYETGGRVYVCSIVVYGSADKKMTETVQAIFDTIKIDSEAE